MHRRPQPPDRRGRRPASGTILAIVMIIAIIIVGGLSAWSRLGSDDDDGGAFVDRPVAEWSHHGS